jgi:uncharacterized protein (UPF0332 family)
MSGGVNPHDLIAVSRLLVSANPTAKPKLTHLRRAVSTTYYALFHSLAACCADMMIGTSGAQRSEPAWLEVYRALNHGRAKQACASLKLRGFPVSIQDFANEFSASQERRHKADYDPGYRPVKSDVLAEISQAELVLKKFEATPVKDRRAFASLVLFNGLSKAA